MISSPLENNSMFLSLFNLKEFIESLMLHICNDQKWGADQKVFLSSRKIDPNLNKVLKNSPPFLEIC